ncbi:MAG: ABC transporter ATP-binding protein, partial [Sediminibacterium sp.]
NHLDMHSVELLAEALNKYEGSYILVSHDRYFISKTANKIWEIVDHQIKEFKGSYQEWVDWNERMEKHRKANIGESKEIIKPAIKKEPVKAADPVVKNTQPINKELQKELQKQQKRLSQIEESLSKAQEEQKRIEIEMGNPATYTNKSQFAELEIAYKGVKERISSLNKEYEQVFEQVIELEAKQ